MLFLAVFCGFLAENKREHIVEERRAKEYAKSFLNDLVRDTVELSGAIQLNRLQMGSMDSLIKLASSYKEGSTVPGSFYKHSRILSYLWVVDWSRSSMMQLVQSGNLRYFKNKELVNDINAYYRLQNIISRINSLAEEFRMKSTDLRGKILESEVYVNFRAIQFLKDNKWDSTSRIDSLSKLRCPLSRKASEYINEFVNLLIERKWRQGGTNRNYMEAIDHANKMMQTISHDYDLDLQPSSDSSSNN
jgi:hypothetical protein